MPDLVGDIFVASLVSGYDFGHIDDEVAAHIGCAAGPIRLKYGYAGPKGFGLNHVLSNKRRMFQLEVNGFSKFETFAYRVCQQYDNIRDGGNNKLILVKAEMISGNLLDLRIILSHHQSDEPHWGITTGLITRISREPIKYNRKTRTDGSVPTPDVAERPRFETLSLPKTSKIGDNGS